LHIAKGVPNQIDRQVLAAKPREWGCQSSISFHFISLFIVSAAMA
jgi:hypothetical protein